MKRALPFLLAALLGLAPRAFAHDVRPAYLELREMSLDTFDVTWKVPGSGDDTRASLAVSLPEGCVNLTEPHGVSVAGSFAERWTMKRPGGIGGGTIRIAGLSATKTDALVRIYHLGGKDEIYVLHPDTPSVTLAGSSRLAARVLAYFGLGVEHIAQGVDHLLFVLGLLLIVRNHWMLFKTISAFTLAHSITLAAATLGYVRAPIPPVEASIALSILLLGPEVVRVWRGETSFTIRHPWVVAFSFGLLHGFGFASGLASIGLPKAEIPLALLLFNVGVEAGQLAFVLLMLGLARALRGLGVRWPRWAELVPGYVVGGCGAYWMIQRVGVIFSGPR